MVVDWRIIKALKEANADLEQEMRLEDGEVGETNANLEEEQGEIKWSTRWTLIASFALISPRVRERTVLLEQIRVYAEEALAKYKIEDCASLSEGLVELERKLPSSVIVADAVRMGVWCTTRRTWIKTPGITRARKDQALAFTHDLDAPTTACNDSGCLFHNNIQVYCSHALEEGTSHGYPLCFFIDDKGKVTAVTLRLAKMKIKRTDFYGKAYSKTKMIILIRSKRFRGE
ncbi:hypothetical protein BASA81_018257 [Batrachochytrium salamandrivorans]|nr:hypothetical protein BASA81_018257 [Batrachochytrium salamandrivorans]